MLMLMVRMLYRPGQYTVTLVASNAISRRTVTADLFVLRSVCKPPDIALLPANQHHAVSFTAHLGCFATVTTNSFYGLYW